MRRAALAILLLLLAGCFASKGTRDGSERLADAYADTPGTTQVRTQSGVDGQGQEYVETVVSLDPDATAEQVADVVVGHPAEVEEAGLDDGVSFRYLRLELPDGATLAVDWKGVPDEAAVREGVEHWLLVSDLVGIPPQLVLGSDGSELYGVEGEGPDAVGDIYRTIAADPVLGADDAVWDVTSSDGAATLRLAADPLPTEPQLTAWGALVTSLGKLPVAHAATGLDVALADRATVQVDLSAPAGTAPETFTPAAYGALLWPALHDQLDVVGSLAPDWGYFVDWAPADSPTSSRSLVSLLSDAEPADNGDTATRWSQAAYDYVHRR